MKNTINKTTVIIFVLLAVMVIFPAGVFAGGNQESSAEASADQIEIENYSNVYINYDLKGDENHIYIDIKDFAPKYGVVRTTDKYGSTIYKELNSGETLTVSNNNEWADMFSGTQSPAAVTLSEAMQEKYCNIIDPKISSGGYSNSNINDEYLDSMKITNQDEVVISYDKYGLSKEYDIVLVNSARNEYYRYQFKLIQEFFPGEFNLFSEASVSSYTYEKKAVAALGLVCGAEFITAYSTLGTEPVKSNSD